MNRRLLVVIGALAMAGCASTPPAPMDVQLSFVNDTGRPATVQVLGRTDKGFHDASMKDIPMPKRALVLQILSDRCAYLYGVPVEDLPSPSAAPMYTTLQVETDLSLYATSSLAAVPVSTLAARQPPGFPIKPVAHACADV